MDNMLTVYVLQKLTEQEVTIGKMLAQPSCALQSQMRECNASNDEIGKMTMALRNLRHCMGMCIIRNAFLGKI